MITALDTNILSAVIGGDPSQAAVRAALQRATQAGPLMVCGAVFAELCAMPLATEAAIDAFLQGTGVQVDWVVDEAVWRASGQAFSGYAARRRASGGGLARRVLADFLIGAHAAHKADQLLTLDPRHYTLGFPGLSVVAP